MSKIRTQRCWEKWACHKTAGLAVAVLVLNTAPVCSGMNLAEEGKTSCTIMLPEDAIPAEQFAARELADFLGQMTGAKFPVATEGSVTEGPKIILGCGKLAHAGIPDSTLQELGPEEFMIKTVGKDVILAGGRPRGTLYAVYHLLDNVLGIRWWAPGATDIPGKRTLELANLDLRLKPAFEYRDVFLTTAWNSDWARRNRLNSRVRYDKGSLTNPSEEHGGGISFDPGYVHTFNVYIPASVHFDQHPDWFPMIDGKRVKGYYQLCLTNPEVVNFMVEQVRATMQKNPQIRIFSLSQNDTKGNCQCPACAKIDTEEGSPAGSLLRFVNTVAERLEKDYPQVFFETLAYQYTRKPPAITKPRKNVIIRLCTIECSFSQPLDRKVNQAFAADLQGWGKIADTIYIWDYIANFSNYFRPHPNLYVLGPNLRYFADNHVKGVFEEGSEPTPAGEMEELRAWVLARLLWNPRQDDRALIHEFVNGYYGPAAPFIRKYLELIHASVLKTDYGLNCFAGDPAPHITCETMTQAAGLFAKAEAVAAARPKLLKRVRRAHMPVQVTWLSNYASWAAEAKKRHLPAPLPYETIFRALSDQVQADGVNFLAAGRAMEPWLKSMADPVLQKTAKSSGNYGGGMPWNVFDGDPNSTLNFGGYGPQWIQRDLQTAKKVKSINSDFGPRYTETKYRIEASLNEVKWKVIVPEKIVKGHLVTDDLAKPVRARYIKTIILQSSSAGYPNDWVGMAEQTIVTK